MSLIDKLIGLPLPAQTQWAVLYHCLQHRVAHYLRAVPWADLRDHLPAVEDATLRGLSHTSWGLPTSPRCSGFRLSSPTAMVIWP